LSFTVADVVISMSLLLDQHRVPLFRCLEYLAKVLSLGLRLPRSVSAKARFRQLLLRELALLPQFAESLANCRPKISHGLSSCQATRVT
jgi:hypothetical protein